MCHHSSAKVSSVAGYECVCFENYHLCNDGFSCVTNDGYNKYNRRGVFDYQGDTEILKISAYNENQFGYTLTFFIDFFYLPHFFIFFQFFKLSSLLALPVNSASTANASAFLPKNPLTPTPLKPVKTTEAA